MQGNGIKGTMLSDVTYNSIMNILCNEVPRVETFIFLNVIERKKCYSHSYTFSTRIHILSREGYLEEVEDFPKICQLMALFETLFFTAY